MKIRSLTLDDVDVNLHAFEYNFAKVSMSWNELQVFENYNHNCSDQKEFLTSSIDKIEKDLLVKLNKKLTNLLVKIDELAV